MNFLILIPTLAFIALHFVRVHPMPGGTWKAIVVWVGLLVGAAALLSRLPPLFFYPDNEVLRLVGRESYRIHREALKKDDVVLLIEGSSAVTRCVKEKQLEDELQRRGLPARVFQISAGGSNHFERLAMLREWLRGLSPKDAKHLQNARVILLEEVLYLYDFSPLQGFAENAFSDRSIAYTTSENVIPMLESALEKLEVRHSTVSPSLVSLIAQHYLFNVFRVGTFPPVAAPKAIYSANGPGSMPRASAAVDDLPVAVPAVTPSAPAAPTPAASIPSVAGAPRQPASPAATPFPKSERFDFTRDFTNYQNHRDVSLPMNLRHLPFPWWEIYDREIHRLAAGPVDQIGYLIPPTIDPVLRKYQQKFIETQPAHLLVIDGGSDVILRHLASPACWSDDLHLRPEGAAIFTRLLADQIAARWPEISGQAAKSSSEKSAP